MRKIHSHIFMPFQPTLQVLVYLEPEGIDNRDGVNMPRSIINGSEVCALASREVQTIGHRVQSDKAGIGANSSRY